MEEKSGAERYESYVGPVPIEAIPSSIKVPDAKGCGYRRKGPSCISITSFAATVSGIT